MTIGATDDERTRIVSGDIKPDDPVIVDTAAGTGEIPMPADYSLLGWLLITVALVSVVTPLAAIALVQRSALRTNE